MGAAYEIVAKDRNRMAWLKARKDGLGGSEAAAVLGVSPWQSALEVYAEKVSSSIDDASPSEFAKWGKILEPHVIEEFRSRTGRPVRREGRLLRSRARTWQLTTLDARQFKRASGPPGPPGLLEVKTTKFSWERIPEDIWAQVQHQFAVTGFHWGSIAVFNRTSCETAIVPVERDREYIAELNEIEEKFWRDLEQGIPPAPDGSESSRNALRLLYPTHVEGKRVDLAPSFIGVGQTLEATKERIKALLEDRRIFENQITAAIGDAEVGVLPDGSEYTYRTQLRKETIQKASSFRVLRRKEAK